MTSSARESLYCAAAPLPLDAFSAPHLMWILRTLLLLTLLCAGLATDANAAHASQKQSPTAPPVLNEITPEMEAAFRAEEEAFDAIYGRFQNELRGYDFDILQLKRQGVKRADLPQSPVFAYLPLVEAMAVEGNGPALLWLVEFSDQIVLEEADRATYCRANLNLLAKDHASAPYMMSCLDHARARRFLLGEEFLLQFYRQVQEGSLRHEVQAKAFYCEGEQLLMGDGGADIERVERANEIWETLVYGYPTTKSAIFGGNRLFDQVIRDMRLAGSAWLARVRELDSQGVSTTEWPPYPVAEFEVRLMSIAATGHPLAKRWVEKFLPAFDQASRDGLGEGLAAFTNWMTLQFSHSSPPWNELRFGLLDVLYSAFPDAPGVRSTLESLNDNLITNTPENYVPVLDRLIEHTSDAVLRFDAKLCKARILEFGSTEQEFATALALYEEIQRDAPSLGQRESGRQLGLELAWAMPGAMHPTINEMDSHGLQFSSLDYHGKVILLYFWSQHAPGGLEDLEWVSDFNRRHLDRDVVVLGLNADLNSVPSFHAKTREFGITFRNALIQSRKSMLALQYKVGHFPTAIVIDQEGRIRGRNQSHEDIDALVARLIAEAEGASASLAARGSLKGQVRFGGEATPLPPLELTPEQLASCTSNGKELDRTDRSRLVSAEGGLANVVITLENRGATMSGEVQTFVIDGRECRFEPHVILVPRNSKIDFRNSDSIARHIKVSSVLNRSFKAIVPPGGVYGSEVKAADFFQVKSESHPWMSAWVAVTDSPFAALSAANGTFQIPSLPAGEYQATWWHETLGRGETAKFVVKAGETTTLDFTIE